MSFAMSDPEPISSMARKDKMEVCQVYQHKTSKFIADN